MTEGYIASFDLKHQVKDRQFYIPLDPYGLAATSDEGLVVTSGSGQPAEIHVFDGVTGELRSTSSRLLMERSAVALHPSEVMVQ